MGNEGVTRAGFLRQARAGSKEYLILAEILLDKPTPF